MSTQPMWRRARIAKTPGGEDFENIVEVAVNVLDSVREIAYPDDNVSDSSWSRS